MKLIWLLTILVASCKTVPENQFAGGNNNRLDYKVEITFLNSGANYSAIMNAIHQNGFTPEIQYGPITGSYPGLAIVGFRCCEVSPTALSRFKNALGSCNGVVTIHESIVD